METDVRSRILPAAILRNITSTQLQSFFSFYTADDDS